MKRITFGLGLLLGVASVGWAGPETRPATQPAAEGPVKALIAQLGAEDYQAREKAAEELRKIGKPALPALKEAARDPDPEVQARASALAKEMEGVKPKKPVATRREPVFIGPGQFQNNVRVQIRGGAVVRQHMVNVNNSREITHEENGYKVHIREDGKGLTMTVTQTVDGKEDVKEYKAKDAEELKKNNPEAYKVYEKYSGQNGQMNIRIEGGQIQLDDLKIDLNDQ